MVSLGDIKTETTKNNDKKKIIYLERNGRIFPIIEHFSEEKTYTDIIKNAVRRELESIWQILQNGMLTCFYAIF